MPILASLRHAGETLFALDTPSPVRLNPWESCLSGWFVAAALNFEEGRVLGALVEGSFVPALYGLPRPDVARHLNDPALANCGFYIRFRGPKWSPLIKIVTQGKSGAVVLAEVNAPLGTASCDSAVPIDSYQAWLNCREASLFWPETEIYDRLSALPYRPLISVLLPAVDPDPFYFEQCVQSVLRQKYAHWQLCISQNLSHSPSVEHLQRWAASESRITIAFSSDRLGAAEAQNVALKNAQGDFIVALGQQDELHPCALLEVVRLLNRRDACEAVYSDEDTIDLYGSRGKPVFKADIDPDLLLASDYIGRLAALKRKTVVDLGGFRSVCEGVHDWDLFIRLLEQAGPRAIQHLAKPLYHRRLGQQPAVLDVPRRLAARKASLAALSDHVHRLGKSAVLETGLSPDSFRLKHQAPNAAKTAVFVLHEDGPFQIATVGMAMKRDPNISLFVVKDCAVYPFDSSPQSALPALPDLSADVLLFINRPLESLNHLFFEELTAEALRGDCGVAAGISVNAEKRILHSGYLLATGDRLIDPFAGLEFSYAFHPGPLSATRSVEMISDRFFAVRRESLSALGGLSAVSAGQMPQLVHQLVSNSKGQGLRVIVTPFAVAAFHEARPEAPVDPVGFPDRGGVSLNPNLLEFADLAQAMKGFI